MHVAKCLDTHFSTQGHWQGLRLGWTTGVWLAFILSEGDHRLYRVEPWGKEHLCTRRRSSGLQVSPHDLTEDRLATIWSISASLNAGARVTARSMSPCCASTTGKDAESASTPQRQRPT